MNIKDIIEKTGCIAAVESECDVKSAYICDLLSIVMNKAEAESLWLTVQTHKNIIAVAKMAEIPAIIVCDGFEIDADTIKAAEKEHIALLQTGKNAYELSGILHGIGLQ